MTNGMRIHVELHGKGFDTAFAFEIEGEDTIQKAFDVVEEIIAEAERRQTQSIKKCKKRLKR